MRNLHGRYWEIQCHTHIHILERQSVCVFPYVWKACACVMERTYLASHNFTRSQCRPMAVHPHPCRRGRARFKRQSYTLASFNSPPPPLPSPSPLIVWYAQARMNPWRAVKFCEEISKFGNLFWNLFCSCSFCSIFFLIVFSFFVCSFSFPLSHLLLPLLLPVSLIPVWFTSFDFYFDQLKCFLLV